MRRNDPVMDNGQKHKIVPFYDELENLALQRRSVEIVFRGENGARTVVRDRIGLFVLEGRECLRTGAGLVIGLEQLLEVDGKRPPEAC